MSADQYTTLDVLKPMLGIDAVETQDNAVLNVQLAALITGVSRAIDQHCKRHFYRKVETRVFDVPRGSSGRPGRLWLSGDLLDVTELVGGDGVIPGDRYTLYPVNQSVHRWIELRYERFPTIEWTTKLARRGVVQITGGWGYVTTESEAVIPLACQLWVMELYARAQHPAAQSVSIGNYSTSYASSSEQRVPTITGDTELVPPGNVAQLLRSFILRDLASAGY